MQNVTFALPTVATAGMSPADQRDIILNQATAAIVAEYLGHMNLALDKGIVTTTAGTGVGVGFITQNELVSLINDVQFALRSI